MKTFIYTTKIEQKRTYQKRTCNVYKVVKNSPIFVGQIEFNSGMSRGAESEVFNLLVELKLIPKKLLNISKCSWRGPGYYCPEVSETCKIIGL